MSLLVLVSGLILSSSPARAACRDDALMAGSGHPVVVEELNSARVYEFVRRHTVKVTPEFDGPKINLTFFAIGLVGEPSLRDFLRIAGALRPKSGERNYISIGAELGDQDLALRTMALGHLLGAWRVLGPEQVTPDLPADRKRDFAEMGLVTITAEVPHSI